MGELGGNDSSIEKVPEKPAVPVWEEQGFPTRVALDKALRENLVPYDKRQQMLSGQAAIPSGLFDNKPFSQAGPIAEQQAPVLAPPTVSDGRPKSKDRRKGPGVIEAPPRRMNPLKSGTYSYDPQHPVVIPHGEKRNGAVREAMFRKLAQMRNHSQGK